jgi:hypothetical protein
MLGANPYPDLDAMSRSDRFYDFSLHMLIVAVSVGMVGCIGFLVYRWLYPAPAADTQIQFVQAERTVPDTPVIVAPALQNQAQVLAAPGQIFRCVSRGRTSFSDQPCAQGPSVPAAGAARH